MARKSIARIVRASGIETSGNGKYFYWKCIVSGQETFAPEPRFKDVVKKYGSEEKLFKTYVLRPVQKYVDAGWDADSIIAILKENDGKLPALDNKPAKPTKASKNLPVCEVELVKQPEQPKVLIFPWSGNPDYFKSPHVPLNFENETKNSCVYPNRNLNDRCYGFRDAYENVNDLKRQLANNYCANQWNNFTPRDKDYEYMMQKKEIYNRVCSLFENEGYELKKSFW